MKFLRHISFLCVLVLPGLAQAQSPRLSEILDARMRSGWQTENGTHMAALHLRLAGNWITYWRHPGETGIAPRLDWSASHNLANARIHWPEPRLYSKAGMASIGYSREIVLPIELTPADPGLPFELDATLTLGVCDDICIPVDLALQLGVSDTGRPDGMIATALTQTPRKARSAGLVDVSCDITPENRGVRLSATLTLPPQGTEEFALIEMTGPPIRSTALPSERKGDTITGHTLFRLTPGHAIDRSAVRISVVSENGVVQHQGCSVAD